MEETMHDYANDRYLATICGFSATDKGQYVYKSLDIIETDDNH